MSLRSLSSFEKVEEIAIRGWAGLARAGGGVGLGSGAGLGRLRWSGATGLC